MSIILRAIATGLGLKIGAELGKFISEKVKELAGIEDKTDSDPGSKGADADDDLPGTSPEPPVV